MNRYRSASFLTTAALLTFAKAGMAQVTAENQQPFLAVAKSNGEVLKHFVEAVRHGDAPVASSLIAPGAALITTDLHYAPLDADAFNARARACTATYGINPEIIGGRATLPQDKMSVFWSCPASSAIPSARTDFEFRGGKIAFARMFEGSAAAIVAAPR